MSIWKIVNPSIWIRFVIWKSCSLLREVVPLKLRRTIGALIEWIPYAK